MGGGSVLAERRRLLGRIAACEKKVGRVDTIGPCTFLGRMHGLKEDMRGGQQGSITWQPLVCVVAAASVYTVTGRKRFLGWDGLLRVSGLSPPMNSTDPSPSALFAVFSF